MGVFNETLKAVIIEVSAGNIWNHHVNLRGAFGLFADDCLGGNHAASAAQTITVIVGREKVETDIDAAKAIFRRRGPIRRFFQDEALQEGDLVMLERLDTRLYALSKASKRGFKYYL